MGMFSESCISVLESRSQSGHKYISDMIPDVFVTRPWNRPEQHKLVGSEVYNSWSFIHLFQAGFGAVQWKNEEYGQVMAAGFVPCQGWAVSGAGFVLAAAGAAFPGSCLGLCVIPQRHWSQLISHTSLSNCSLVLLFFAAWSLALVFCKSREFIPPCVLGYLVPQSRTPLESSLLWNSHSCGFREEPSGVLAQFCSAAMNNFPVHSLCQEGWVPSTWAQKCSF